MADSTVLLRGRAVPLTVSPEFNAPPDIVPKVASCYTFTRWLNATKSQKDYHVHRLELRHVDFFGPHVSTIKLRIWTLKAGFDDEATAIVHNVILKGTLAALLIVFTCGSVRYIVLTSQPRVPAATFGLLELPVGLIDSSGAFCGMAAQELSEELGLKLNAADLTDLSSFVRMKGEGGLLLSPGHTDEQVKVYCLQKDVSQEQLDAWMIRVSVQEGDLLDLHIVPFNDVWKRTVDCKTLAAVHLLDMLESLGDMKEDA